MQGELRTLADAAAEVFERHDCVSAWIGFGNVLYLGFDSAPAEPSNASQSEAPYKLNVNMADWQLSSPESLASCDDEAVTLEPIVASLVHRRVLNWAIDDRRSLRIDFIGGLSLEIMPVTDFDVTDSDAWSVTLPNDRIVAVSCGGRIVTVHRRTPIREWFKKPEA